MDPTLWEQSQTNLADFLRSEWLPAIRSSVRETTFANYVSHVDCHLIPGIGVLALGEIDGRRLNAFYAGLLSEGRVDGKGALAPSSVRRIHAALHKALADAVRWGYLSDNPADAADPPKLRALAPKEMTTWTAQELRSFLDCAHDDPLYPLWFVLATTGMRRGEALGLRWRDVDVDAGQIAVRQSLVPVGGKIRLSTPKTNRGRRVVAIDVRTSQVLRDHRSHHTNQRPCDLLFPGTGGEGLSPTAVTKSFRNLVEASGLPRIRLHDLRHTHATIALETGIHPKIVSERLGHSTVSLTLDVYSHAVPHMQRDAAAQIAEAVFQGGVRG
jgi:integrase